MVPRLTGGKTCVALRVSFFALPFDEGSGLASPSFHVLAWRENAAGREDRRPNWCTKNQLDQSLDVLLLPSAADPEAYKAYETREHRQHAARLGD